MNTDTRYAKRLVPFVLALTMGAIAIKPALSEQPAVTANETPSFEQPYVFWKPLADEGNSVVRRTTSV